jgi:hypothetical protein
MCKHNSGQRYIFAPDKDEKRIFEKGVPCSGGGYGIGITRL